MRPAPTFREFEETLAAVIAGRMSRQEADAWAGQWVYATESHDMEKALWKALMRLAGCDLRHDPDADYLHSEEQLREWLQELRANERRAT